MTTLIHSSSTNLVKQVVLMPSKIGQKVLQKSTSFGSSITKKISGSFHMSGMSGSSHMSGASNPGGGANYNWIARRMANDESKPNRDPYLLEQLGGMVALKSIVQEFCRRVIQHPDLQGFFLQADPHLLTTHQERFFALAFTKVNIPEARLVIRRVHKRMFAQGLCETHFDTFVDLFASTLRDRGFAEPIVQQSTGVLAPLREIFMEAVFDERMCMAGNPPRCSEPIEVVPAPLPQIMREAR